MVARKKLPPKEIAGRARNIRLVLTDNDGVLTDTGVYYNENGEAFKRFSIRDGMGVELLRTAGIETAIITSESSPSVRKRAEKLRMNRLYLGIKHKAEHLEVILKENGLTVENLAYIGDDVNDLEIIRIIARRGLTAAPADAMPVVRREVHYRCRFKGGNGAFRDFGDWIIALRAANRNRQTKGM
jgi:3-deoxy-D-manno-octulosonate 8-phosphate phosphatase (KDO 8-P phosphatase)